MAPTAGCDRTPLSSLLKTLRNAQVRRISWVRGVRPVRERYEWPPHDAAPDRPPIFPSVPAEAPQAGIRADIERTDREIAPHHEKGARRMGPSASGHVQSAAT